MKPSPEACCIVCQLVFCCGSCRWKHEKIAHGLLFDCPICRDNKYLCKPEELSEPFLRHLTEQHAPLQCNKCNKLFNKMEDFLDIDKCTSISELVPNEQETNKSQGNQIDERFDSIYEKTKNSIDELENVEGIISVNKSSKTAVITPIIRKNHLVDYASSESDTEEIKLDVERMPHTEVVPKTPRPIRHRVATPHAKKFLTLIRQKVINECEEKTDNEDYNGLLINNSETTPSRNENEIIPENRQEITTPTSQIQPNILKLAQAVTTSTPTHPVNSGWSMFTGQGADSPLSEIENADSPSQQSVTNKPSKMDSDPVLPKLKSIIITGSRIRLGSQDSSEKPVTFQDSLNSIEASSTKIKKVKFAQDTIFEPEPKLKRVYRKPKRMLTPGPQRPRLCHNPRFQALINRFENKALTFARTPVPLSKDICLENTPPVGDYGNIPARAIDFKEDSPIVETENHSKESNELFKSCVDSPVQPGVNDAITAFTANIAGTLQNCLSSVLGAKDEETEIQFKFVISKKKVSVKRITEDNDGIDERLGEMDRNTAYNKENIWSSVAKAVKNVFWGEQETNLAVTTPYRPVDNNESLSSSKRKCSEMTDPEMSPLNHKRHKYDGRIRGRPPLRRSKTWGVSSLRSTQSAEQHRLLKEVSINNDLLNLSF